MTDRAGTPARGDKKPRPGHQRGGLWRESVQQGRRQPTCGRAEVSPTREAAPFPSTPPLLAGRQVGATRGAQPGCWAALGACGALGSSPASPTALAP